MLCRRDFASDMCPSHGWPHATDLEMLAPMLSCNLILRIARLNSLLACLLSIMPLKVHRSMPRNAAVAHPVPLYNAIPSMRTQPFIPHILHAPFMIYAHLSSLLLTLGLVSLLVPLLCCQRICFLVLHNLHRNLLRCHFGRLHQSSPRLILRRLQC